MLKSKRGRDAVINRNARRQEKVGEGNTQEKRSSI